MSILDQKILLHTCHNSCQMIETSRKKQKEKKMEKREEAQRIFGNNYTKYQLEAFSYRRDESVIAVVYTNMPNQINHLIEVYR